MPVVFTKVEPVTLWRSGSILFRKNRFGIVPPLPVGGRAMGEGG